MPNPCGRLNHTLQLLVDAVQAAEDDIDTSIKAWETLRLTYKEVHKGSGETVQSFESWGPANINTFLIRRIEEWIQTAHFESLSDTKKTELRKIARAFNTDIWMIYFVLGEGLIAESVKGLKGILRCRRVLKDLALETLLNKLETAREARRGVRSRNLSNNMTKFTLSNVKCCELALCPMPLSPPCSSAGDRSSVTPDPEPATPNLQTHCGNPPQLKRKTMRRLPGQRLRNPQTPPGSDDSDSDSDSDNDIDIEQGRRCTAVFDEIPFSSDEIIGDWSPCVRKHSIFSTPLIGNKHAQPLSMPQIHTPIEFSPLNKSAYSPNLFGSNDDGSREFTCDIPERDDGILFDNMDQDDNSEFYMEVPIQATAPDSPKPPSCMCRRLPLAHDTIDQNPQYKRRRTMAHSPDLTMDEASPQMIVQMIVAAEQLTQLATVPLLQDHGQRDLVDSKTWRFLQNFIIKPTLQSDPIIDPINIIKCMGFPCVAHLLGAFRLSYGEVSHAASSSTCSTLDAEDDNCDIPSYLQCLPNYTSSAERAIASAQVLRELIRRSQNAVQSLQIEYDKDMEHLKIYAPTPSAIRYHIQANAQEELSLLMHSLKVLFEHTQNMVGELKEYRLQVQAMQNGIQRLIHLEDGILTYAFP